MKKLHLAPELELPADAVTQTFAFLARRGAGKTYGASKLAEEMLELDAQIVVLDPIGNWYGLRLAADGKGKGYSIPVFGGLRGDIPLEPHAGALVADLVVDRGLSVVLDVSMFRKGDRKRFATDFAEQLFHRKKSAKSALHLFVEEAQVFVPQRAMGDEARMLGAFEDLVKLGRNFGIGVTLISQRPQSVNKDALNQTECLVVLQTNGAQERKAIREWIVDQGMSVPNLVEELPSLKKGEAWIWSPSWLCTTKRVHIAKKRTFNASATPEVGKAEVTRELAPVDLEAIRKAMATVIEEAEGKDPKALRRRVAELQAELAKRPTAKVETKEVPVLTEKQIKRLEGFARAVLEGQEKLAGAIREIAPAMELVHQHATRVEAAPNPERWRELDREAVVVARQLRAAKEVRAGDGSIKRGAREMLRALASRHPTPLTRRQLGTLAGFKASGGTFGDYLSSLRRAGFIADDAGGDLVITEAGLDFLGPNRPDAPQTTAELVALWGARLKRGARQMLQLLVEQHPAGFTKSELGQLVNMEHSGGTFGDYLSALRSNGLVEVRDGLLFASETLFPRGRAA